MLKKLAYLVAGSALALSASAALAQAPAGTQQPAAGPSGGVDVQYNGPPIIHIPGERQGMYPRVVDTRQPGALQNFVNENGVRGIQDAVDGTLQECLAITELGSMVDDYDQAIDAHDRAGQRLEHDAPRHARTQQVLTGLGAVADVGTGVISATHGDPITGIAYAVGGVFRGLKQRDNDQWQNRLDRHFLSGAAIQVQGTRVFTFSERIYQRAMAREVCPGTESYVAAHGRAVSLTPVNQQRR